MNFILSYDIVYTNNDKNKYGCPTAKPLGDIDEVDPATDDCRILFQFKKGEEKDCRPKDRSRESKRWLVGYKKNLPLMRFANMPN